MTANQINSSRHTANVPARTQPGCPRSLSNTPAALIPSPEHATGDTHERAY
jgi:hypothetical protein